MLYTHTYIYVCVKQKLKTLLSPRGDKVPFLKIMPFSMPTFEQLQWMIPVTEKSLSEQCEGGFKCCATGKPERLF